MKILFVGMYPDEVNRYRNVFFQNLIYAMADAGIDCTVISPVPVTRYLHNVSKVSKKRVDITPKGAKVDVYHPRYVSLSAKKIGKMNTGICTEKLFQKSALKCAKQIDKSFDVVYGHFFLSGGLAAIKIAKSFSLPAFVAYGECNYETEILNLYRELKESEIQGLSGVIAVSSHNAKVLKGKAIFKGIPMIIAPNSVDATLFFKRDKELCRKQLGIPLDKFLVGFVGGFVERKGDKRLLTAINNIEDVYVAFAGRGDNPPVGKKVVFCEALEHEQIPVFLNALDVFCLPTLNEGSCNAIVEAAFCGLPIVSSDLPFNDDLLTNTNSIRIDPNSVADIQNALVALFENSTLREELSDNILNDSKVFTIEQRCGSIVRFISAVTNDNRNDVIKAKNR